MSLISPITNQLRATDPNGNTVTGRLFVADNNVSNTLVWGQRGLSQENFLLECGGGYSAGFDLIPYYSSTSADGNYHDIFTFNQNVKVQMKRFDNNTLLARWVVNNVNYDAEGVNIGGGILSTFDHVYLCVLFNGSQYNFGVVRHLISNATWDIGGNSTSVVNDIQFFIDALEGSIVPTYTWTSWPQISGNDGMFLMDLSKIDDSIIGDGATVYETFDNTKFTLNSLTDLYTMTINLLNSQETTIAYCGDNYLTATKRTTFVNDVTTVYVTLKFHYRSDLLIYTTPELTVYSSDGAVSRDYLSIMYDEEHEVAAPNIIQLWTATGKYGINEYSLPSEEQMRALYIWLLDNGEERETISPYDIGTTDTGGDPNTPTPQDHITDSDLPTLSGLNLGVVTLYLPTTEQLQSIASFLWSDNVLDNFKKYFNNFADNLLNLFVLPYHPAGLVTRTFKVGNMTSEITDVEYTTQRFYDVDMGSINIEKLWDSYLDFSPYTKIEIFLPYLGLHSLDIDEIMCPAKMDGTLQRGLGSVLSVVYRIDVLTGVVVAKIKINGEIRYQFEGRVGANIPLTGQTYASMVQGIITAGAGLVSTVATGGLTAPLSAAAAVSGTINASKPSIERIGNISGDASMLATDVPYIVITRPNKPMLEEQEKYTGFPSYKSGTLNNFSGLTICEDVHVEGISCTEEERNAIVDWLKNGVIL